MIQLSHRISPDRRTLTIIADAAARAELTDMRDELNADGYDGFGSNDALWDAFEHLICNSELTWIDPATCGDLTDAPILGILGETTTEPGGIQVGHWGDPPQSRYQPVEERWGFMSYAVRSPLQDLIDTGEAVFTAP